MRPILVWSFLALFAFCGVFGFELWPMSGWRLFANTREQRHTSWIGEASFTDGTTGGIPMSSAGASDTAFLIGRIDELEPNERNPLCEEWLEFAPGITRIAIYRSVSDLAVRNGDRGSPPMRQLAYTCEGGVINEADA